MKNQVFKKIEFPSSLVDLKSVQWDPTPQSFEKACGKLLKKLDASMQAKVLGVDLSAASCWQHAGTGWVCTTVAATCEPVTFESITKAMKEFEALYNQKPAPLEDVPIKFVPFHSYAPSLLTKWLTPSEPVTCQHCDDREIWSKASHVTFSTPPCDECIQCALDHELTVTIRKKVVKIARSL